MHKDDDDDDDTGEAHMHTYLARHQFRAIAAGILAASTKGLPTFVSISARAIEHLSNSHTLDEGECGFFCCVEYTKIVRANTLNPCEADSEIREQNGYGYGFV